jgi:hypothetical protein
MTVPVYDAERALSRKRPKSKRSRLKEALGIAGVSLSLAGGASASTTMPAPYATSHLLYEEEVSDVTLATFHYVDEKSHSFAEEDVFRIAASKGAGAGTGAGRVQGTGTFVRPGPCNRLCVNCYHCNYCVAACKRSQLY